MRTTLAIAAVFAAVVAGPAAGVSWSWPAPRWAAEAFERTDIQLQNGAADFAWIDHWFTYTKAPVERGAGGGEPPTLRGDALHVEKSESASALIYFTGGAFEWYQQGD